MVSKGNHPQMAQHFRLVNYYNLPTYIYTLCFHTRRIRRVCMNTRGLDLKPGVWILALLWLLIKCHNIMIEPFQPLSSDVYHPAAAPFGYLPRPEWPWGTEDQQLLCSVCLRHILIYIRYNPLKHGWSKFGSSGSSATSSIELKSFRSDQIACFNPSWIAGLQISFYNPLGCFFTTSDPAGQPAGSPYEVLTLLYTYPEGVQSGIFVIAAKCTRK